MASRLMKLLGIPTMLGLAATVAASCSLALNRDKWVLTSLTDEDIYSIEYIADDLNECLERLHGRSYSRYVAYRCETGCSLDENQRLSCEQAYKP
jgi:hypothetical protein